MATFEDYLFTKNTRWALWGLLGLFVALLIFVAGVAVGRHSRAGRGAVETSFQPPFMPGGIPLPNGFVTQDHGAVGTVKSVSPPTFTLIERDGDTAVVRFSSTTPLSGAPALAPGQFVIVVGDPAGAGADDDIDARFMRVFPSPPGKPF
jgi:hypothetical protein